MTQLDKLSIATIRSLVIDITNKAKSGHPGMALGSAPLLYTLYTKHLVADPNNPSWINRDRFVLSAGHASALLYAMIHLSGYKLSLEDLKSFRQINSLTPGHPEYKHTEGVDATSGPLGQGIAQAVGLAMAERAIQAQYADGEQLVSHYTYALCGDGCLQEGVSQESISFAGLQKLNKLILFYDANQVTLDGGLDLSFNEDVKKRFEACHWNVLEVNDGNDIEAIDKAINEAKLSKDKPTLIIVHTIIGFGSARQGTSKVHGSPLGEEDGKFAKLSYGFDYPDFTIPKEVYDNFKNTFYKRGQQLYASWFENLELYKANHLNDYSNFINACNNDIKPYLKDEYKIMPDDKDSSRVASGKILNYLHRNIPFLMGGSADVAGSVMTKIENGVNFAYETPNGRNINFGIREFAMSSFQNGMLLHGGLRTYVGCFLVFADYMKASIRLAALSKLPAIYLFSHDSIALGEDGPTHQPIETLAMLRSIPNVNVVRPCDSLETLASWQIALESDETPTALILSRQNLPLLNSSLEGAKKGAYIISEAKNKPQIIIIGTGSEVKLALEAQAMLLEKGVDARVVSMPSCYLFEKQSKEYREQIISLPKDKIFSIEMLSTFGWHKYSSNPYGVDVFGASAPMKDVISKFHFQTEDFVNHILKNI